MSLVLEALQKQNVEKQIKEIFPKKKSIKTHKPLPSIKSKRPAKDIKYIIYLSVFFGLLIIISTAGITKISYILRRKISSYLPPPTITNPILPKSKNLNPLNLKVKGIVWDTKNPIVLIEDQFLSVGDEFMGIKIRKVYLNKVLVEYNGKEHYLYVQ